MRIVCPPLDILGLQMIQKVTRAPDSPGNTVANVVSSIVQSSSTSFWEIIYIIDDTFEDVVILVCANQS